MAHLSKQILCCISLDIFKRMLLLCLDELFNCLGKVSNLKMMGLEYMARKSIETLHCKSNKLYQLGMMRRKESFLGQ
jgi:hypothetical protein